MTEGSGFRGSVQRQIQLHRAALRRLGEGVPAEAGSEGAALARLTRLVSIWPDVIDQDNRTVVGVYAALFAQLLNDMEQLEIDVTSTVDGDTYYEIARHGHAAKRAVVWDAQENRWEVVE